jgi:acyl-homoserine-lactone acylase
MPKRSKGDLAYWAGVLPGDSSETLWTGYHAYEEMPKNLDPAGGWLQNTNDPPWTSSLPVMDAGKFPAYFSARELTARTWSSLRMLSGGEKLSFEKLIALKHSTHLELADRILDDVLAAAGDTTASRVLKAWDRNADNESPGALLFEALMRKFKPVFAVAADAADPVHTPRGLKNGAEAAKALAEAAAEVQKTFGKLDAAYGEFHRFRYRGADLPGNGADGALGAFRVIRYGPADAQGRSAPVHGDTFVACVEWRKGGPRAQVLMSYGNSSQPGTKHDVDQLPLLSAKKLRMAWRLKKDVLANLESKDRF